MAMDVAMDASGEGRQAGANLGGRPDRSEGPLRGPGNAEPTEPTLREPMDQGRDVGFSIYVSCWGDRWHVQVSGKLDAAGASAVLDVAEVLAAREAPAVDLDFSEVTEIDDTGWRAALYAQSLLASSDGGCRLIPPDSTLVHPTGSTHHAAGTADQPPGSAGHAA